MSNADVHTNRLIHDQLLRRRSTVRMTIIAVFVLLAVLALAFLLQRQQNQLEMILRDNVTYTHNMCEQRRSNTLKSNHNWDELAKIERRNKFIDEDIRSARLTVYENAHLVVPSC